MINRIDFEGWVKFAASNLYDYAALETHPLTEILVNPPENFHGSRGEYARRLFSEAIEQLRPSGKEVNPNLPEWRPYFILRQRYVEGVSLQELTTALSISDRQLRRDQHRALDALSARLWDRMKPEEQPLPVEENTGPAPFELHRERLDAREIMQGVFRILQSRAEEEGCEVVFEIGDPAPAILSDRVILRQIFISLLNQAFHRASSSSVHVSALTSGPEVEIKIQFDEPSSGELSPEEDTLDTVRYWAQRINARFERTLQLCGDFQHHELTLTLPRADQKIILVVDDQEPAISLFRRYLARSNFLVVGITRAEQAVETASHLQPAIITLDVMMPQVDGWEVLQSLKLNEDTQDIPILVCSAWEEPELAKSLGAAGFLKKPITQKIFLEALENLGVLAQ